MSTTFGILIPGEQEPVIVARRVNSMLSYSHPLARFIPNKYEVIALDNGAQGITTMYDIHSKILSQNLMNFN
jgi:hypothetical protein